MKPLIFSLYKHPIAASIASQLNIPVGKFIFRPFPDEETYLKIESAVKNKTIIIIDSLDHANQKTIPLLFFAKTVKELGAKQVGLIAPYLAYLRQDKRFQSGEGITSLYFSEILSKHFDWLLTIDPHLHRYHHLNEIYSIPTKIIHTSSVISQWIKKNIYNPLLIGPDIESKQWVEDLSNQISVPYVILEKKRHGDKTVEIKLPDISNYQKCTPVLVDDIISTGQTMLETIKHLKILNMVTPVCIGVHAIFAHDAYQRLFEAKIDNVITCNTIPHSSNQIDVSTLISQSLRQWLIESA